MACKWAKPLSGTDQSHAYRRFRWVQYQLNMLSVQRTGKGVRKALDQLPEDLNSTYINMLCRIAPYDKPLAQDALLWLSFAQRPLSLVELSEAVIIEEGIDDECRLHPPEVILSICQGLVV